LVKLLSSAQLQRTSSTAVPSQGQTNKKYKHTWLKLVRAIIRKRATKLVSCLESSQKLGLTAAAEKDASKCANFVLSSSSDFPEPGSCQDCFRLSLSMPVHGVSVSDRTNKQTNGRKKLVRCNGAAFGFRRLTWIGWGPFDN